MRVARRTGVSHFKSFRRLCSRVVSSVAYFYFFRMVMSIVALQLWFAKSGRAWHARDFNTVYWVMGKIEQLGFSLAKTSQLLFLLFSCSLLI